MGIFYTKCENCKYPERNDAKICSECEYVFKNFSIKNGIYQRLQTTNKQPKRDVYWKNEQYRKKYYAIQKNLESNTQ